MEISAHASQADGSIHLQHGHSPPCWQAVEDIYQSQIQNVALEPQRERDDFSLWKFSDRQRHDIRPHGDDQIFFSFGPRQVADTSCGQDEIPDGVGFEDENAQNLDRVGRRSGIAAVTRPIGVEKLASWLVHPLIGVSPEEVALRL